MHVYLYFPFFLDDRSIVKLSHTNDHSINIHYKKEKFELIASIKSLLFNDDLVSNFTKNSFYKFLGQVLQLPILEDNAQSNSAKT